MSTSVRLDPKTQKAAKKLADQLGLSFSGLLTALVKKAIREGGVDLRTQLTENGFTPEYEQSILKAHEEGGYKSFDSVDEMIKYSKNED